jgi:hypothetical protein
MSVILHPAAAKVNLNFYPGIRRLALCNLNFENEISKAFRVRTLVCRFRRARRTGTPKVRALNFKNCRDKTTGCLYPARISKFALKILRCCFANDQNSRIID